uniref:Uncharacterized protein n=1 Tax=Acrobeloides nanus TaxID=290746 RepID=A0A914EKQ7_9BILA
MTPSLENKDYLQEKRSSNPSFSLIPPPRDENTNPDTILEGSVSTRFFQEVSEINENDIRQSLLVEAKRRRCFGTKAINKMSFEGIEHSCCYHYVLESFTETRSTADACEAYIPGQATATLESQTNMISISTDGGPSTSIFGMQNPWDYEILPDVEFAEQTKVLEMPGTSRLDPCPVCHSEGVSHCFHCRGFGTDKCGSCRGTGMKAGVAHPAIYTHPMIGTFPHSDPSRGYPGSGAAFIKPSIASGGKPYAVGTPVHFMAKAGLPPPGIGQHDLCLFCQGRGIRDCHYCKGHGKKTCTTCAGHGIKDVNEISRKFCAGHLQKSLGACRVIKQRHMVEAFPVAKVKYRLGSKSGIFWVYGNERLCFLPKDASHCCML